MVYLSICTYLSYPYTQKQKYKKTKNIDGTGGKKLEGFGHTEIGCDGTGIGFSCIEVAYGYVGIKYGYVARKKKMYDRKKRGAGVKVSNDIKIACEAVKIRFYNAYIGDDDTSCCCIGIGYDYGWIEIQYNVA